jgi:5'-deoxynucleotidase YfbR-like HD superfamily hydrolase
MTSGSRTRASSVIDVPTPEAFLGEVYFGLASRFRHVYRYSTVPLLRRENTAEHSWYVTFYAWAMAKHLMRTHPTLELDLLVLMERACFHDMEEAETGDMIRRVKYANPAMKIALDDVAQEAIEGMDSRLGAQGDLTRAWSNSKLGPEGVIVATVDILAAVPYLVTELTSGNRMVYPRMAEAAGYHRDLLARAVDGTRDDTATDLMWGRMIPYIQESLKVLRRQSRPIAIDPVLEPAVREVAGT